MNKRFIALTVATLETILVCTTAHAGYMAFDGKGDLFVADPEEHSIWKFTPDGTKSTFASGLKTPVRLAFDAAGNLFVADSDSNSIYKLTHDGKKSTFATGISCFGMAFDRSGNLFVSDDRSDSIFKFTPEGEKSTFASELNPNDMAFDGAGNLFVSDTFVKNSIFKFTPEGIKSTFASGLSSPWGLAFDGAGNLFVAERDIDSILKFSPDGTKTTFASGLKLYDVAFDRSDNLFVASGSTIFKFAPDGIKTTFASDWVSPDKKWEYVGGDEPKIVKAGTNEVALDLSDECPGTGGVIWARDSKRFALDCHVGGRWQGDTSLYQLRGDEWKALKSPHDAVLEILNKTIAAQVKKSGLPKKTELRELWGGKVEVHKWVDSNTLILYGGQEKAVPDSVEPFGAHFLVTLKFDAAGNWKIIKTHQMSEKELEEEQ